MLVSKSCYDSRYRTVYASLGILIELDKEESFLNTDTSQMFVLEENGRLFCGGEISRKALPHIEQAPVSYTHLDVYKRQQLDPPVVHFHVG